MGEQMDRLIADAVPDDSHDDVTFHFAAGSTINVTMPREDAVKFFYELGNSLFPSFSWGDIERQFARNKSNGGNGGEETDEAKAD